LSDLCAGLRSAAKREAALGPALGRGHNGAAALGRGQDGIAAGAVSSATEALAGAQTAAASIGGGKLRLSPKQTQHAPLRRGIGEMEPWRRLVYSEVGGEAALRGDVAGAEPGLLRLADRLAATEGIGVT